MLWSAVEEKHLDGVCALKMMVNEQAQQQDAVQ